MSFNEELFFQVINDIISPAELESWNLPFIRDSSLKINARVVEDIEWADHYVPYESVYSRLPSVLFIPGRDVVCHPVGHGKRLRYIRYLGESCESGPIHCDEIEEAYLFSDDHDVQITIQLNVIIYLNEGFDGGITRFYPDANNYSKHLDVTPRAGRVVVFDRRLKHAAMPITAATYSNRPHKDIVKFSVCYGHAKGEVDRQLFPPGDEPGDIVHHEIESAIRRIQSLCKTDPYEVS
jgi:hypothetical protein